MNYICLIGDSACMGKILSSTQNFVTIDNILIAIDNDPITPHQVGNSTHVGFVVAKNNKIVTINEQYIIVDNDPTSCDGICIAEQNNIFSIN